jgi:predicted nucleotidyltransferase
MNTFHIEDVFGTRARVAVLRTLANVAVPLSIRQVAAQSGVSHVAAASALDSLVEIGVVAASQAGKSRVHWIERENLIVSTIVVPAFNGEGHLEDRAIDVIRDLAGSAYSVVLFGSRARGDNAGDSDYDVLVVERDRRRLDRVMARFDAKTTELWTKLGASVSLLGYTIEEAIALVQRGDNFMDGVLADGDLISGVHPRLWGRDGEGEAGQPGQPQ